MKKVILWFALVFMLFGNHLKAQRAELSPYASMSLLTASPGQELYSVFGHSALRVYDPLTGVDEVYNYGTFDFETPYFYYRFIEGRLLYMLSVTTYNRFLQEYHYEGRAMYEQFLNLSLQQKQEIYNFLQHNRLPANRYYAYDFFYDNCSTRIRDIIEEFVAPDWGTDPFPTHQRSFRDMLKPYLESMPWNRLGIDIALGMPSDRIATPWHYMFLPEEMFMAFAQARLQDGSPLVEDMQVVLEARFELAPAGGMIPSLFFWGVLLMGLASFFRRSWSMWFDRLFFSIMGLVGVLVFFLWFISEHHATNNNMNILWALPTHLYFVFKARGYETSGITRLYFRIVFFIQLILLVAWYWIPQDFHPAFFPIILLMAVKAYAYGFGLGRLLPPKALNHIHR